MMLMKMGNPNTAGSGENTTQFVMKSDILIKYDLLSILWQEV